MDKNNDGKLDLPFADNSGNFTFTYAPAIDDLIDGAGFGAIIRDSLRRRSLLPQLSGRSPKTAYNFHGVFAADFDSDGLSDFILAPYEVPGIPIMMFHNRGNGQFEISQREFFESLLGFSSSSTWESETIIVADLTGDGANDIYIPFYPSREPYQSVFLRNTGSSYVEEAVARGLGLVGVPSSENPEGAQAVDINNDGNLDVYVAHHLLINDGNGYFTNAAQDDYGLPVLFDEGAAFVDYDNDGLLDLYVRTPLVDQQLWRNTGSSGFVNSSVSSGLVCLAQNLEFSRDGDSWADFDSDGDLDLLYSSGTESILFASLFLNQDDGTFRLGYTFNRSIPLPATADLDLDGDLDVAAWHEADENVFAKPSNATSLAVVPVDQQGNQNRYGTTVHVRSLCTNQIQTRVIGANNVYLAQGQYAAHFAARSNCAYLVEVTFLRQGSLEMQAITVPFSPGTEGSLRIFVRRDGYTKEPYLPLRYFFPLISKGPT